ncbi:unnamed protein product [Choristocarpus tenellus]
MLHGAGAGGDHHGAGAGGGAGGSAGNSPGAGAQVGAEPLAEEEARRRVIEEGVMRFNSRHSEGGHSFWQMVEDAPLLLRRLLGELRAGNGRIFVVMLRQGVLGYRILQLMAVVLYVISPVDVIPEAVVGVLGLMDDLLVLLVLLLYVTVVYRAVLVSLDRTRLDRFGGES